MVRMVRTVCSSRFDQPVSPHHHHPPSTFPVRWCHLPEGKHLLWTVDKKYEKMERNSSEADHEGSNTDTRRAADVQHPKASAGSKAAAAAATAAAATAAAATADEEGPEENDLLVVVTGGSKGIGKACVESFAQRGARVLFTYCSDAAASRQVEQSFQPAGRVQGCRLDQGDFDSVRAFAAEVDRWREGREVSTVVNNAALGVATVSDYGGLPPPPPPPPPAGGGGGGGGGGGPAGGTTDTTSGRGGGGGRGGDQDMSGSEEYAAARRRADEDMALMRVNSLGPVWVTEALLPMMMPTPRSNGAGTPASVTAPPAVNSPADVGGGGGGRRDPWLSSILKAKKKKTVLFVGSVGGGSQSVFPGFRVADAMSKAAVAYASKYFAACSRQQGQQGNHAGTSAPAAPAAAVAAAAAHSPPFSQCDSSTANGGGPAATTAAVAVTTAESDFGNPSGDVDFLCLCPGATLTDMFRASTLKKMEAKGPQEVERFLRALPQGRMMLPEEIGEAVYWLCSSPAATMFHGAVIDASAGLAVRPGTLTEFPF